MAPPDQRSATRTLVKMTCRSALLDPEDHVIVVSTAVGPSLITRFHVQVLEAFVELVLRRRIAFDLEE